MKKTLFFSLFFVVTILAIGFWAMPVQAVGCGSADGANPTLMEVNSVATCSSPSDSFEGYFYYFYLDSRQEVHFTVTSQPVNWRVSFALAKKDEWSSKLVPAPGSKYIRTGLWADDGWVIDAGYWEILVIPNPTSQSDDFSGSFQGISSFSLSIKTTRQPVAYCGDGSCNAEETCSSCPSDCGSCAPVKKTNGSSCESWTECAGGWCIHGICRSSSVYCDDGYCDNGESCSSCSSDCGACPSPPSANEPSPPSEYCGDGYCNGTETCSTCSADCGACEKETKIFEIKTLSTAVIDKKGGATQDFSIFFPPEYWKEMAKDVSSSKAIKSAEKELVNSLKKFKLDVKSAKLKLDDSSRALRVKLIYRRYAFPPNSYPEMEGYGDYWILPTVAIGNTIEQGAICKMDEHKMEVRGRVVLLEGKQTQAMESAEALVILQQQFNQAFTLPKEAVDIRTDEEKCVIGYKLASCQPTVQNSCGAKSYCSKETFSCLPRLTNGKACDSGRACLSDNCGLYKEKNMCCGRGKACCLENADCDADQYCENQKSFNCLAKKKVGEKASSPFECQGGWLENSRCLAPKVLSFSFPKEITLKKGAVISVPLAIQNVSQLEVSLDEKILVSQSPDVIEVENGLLKICRQTLAPNETVGTEAEQLENSIDKLVIKAKKPGKGKMILKFNYVADGRLTSKEETISITVSKEHIRASKEASGLFKKKMLWEEIRLIEDKQYVFVRPEDDPQFEGALYNWQQSHAAFSSGVDGLIESAADTLKPELYSFAETVKGLNEAQTPQQITEKTIKSLIPSSLQFGAIFTGMMAPFAKQQKEEQYLLKTFGAKNLVYIADYDEEGSFRGYIVAITKEKGGKIYAVRLGKL